MLNSRKKIGTYWEIIADNLKKRGWSLGWVSAVDSEGRTIFIVDAHRNGKRFVVRADEKLTRFSNSKLATRGSRTSKGSLRTHLVFELPESVQIAVGGIG